MKTYVRVAGGAVAEPAFTLDDAVDVTALFDPSLTIVDVTALGSPPAVGASATFAGGMWTFGSLPLAGIPPIPAWVVRYGLKVALANSSGSGGTMLDNVATWVATQSEAIQLMWSDAAGFARTGPFITAVAAHFSWDGGTIDGWFNAAVAVPTIA